MDIKVEQKDIKKKFFEKLNNYDSFAGNPEKKEQIWQALTLLSMEQIFELLPDTAMLAGAQEIVNNRIRKIIIEFLDKEVKRRLGSETGYVIIPTWFTTQKTKEGFFTVVHFAVGNKARFRDVKHGSNDTTTNHSPALLYELLSKSKEDAKDSLYFCARAAIPTVYFLTGDQLPYWKLRGGYYEIKDLDITEINFALTSGRLVYQDAKKVNDLLRELYMKETGEDYWVAKAYA